MKGKTGRLGKKKVNGGEEKSPRLSVYLPSSSMLRGASRIIACALENALPYVASDVLGLVAAYAVDEFGAIPGFVCDDDDDDPASRFDLSMLTFDQTRTFFNALHPLFTSSTLDIEQHGFQCGQSILHVLEKQDGRFDRISVVSGGVVLLQNGYIYVSSQKRSQDEGSTLRKISALNSLSWDALFKALQMRKVEFVTFLNRTRMLVP
jgi:hypothetical protein